jgi:L-ectoine synthase
MIVRKLKDIIGTERDVDTEGWNSRRLILKDDKMGYSVHDTIIKEGAELTMWYKHHLEAVYLIEGEGEIEDLATGDVHGLGVGTIYALDKHDRHILRANKGTHMRMVCVFNPPVTGQEVHDEDGAYIIHD